MIKQLRPGRDGIVSAVRGERKIQHLYPLELQCKMTISNNDVNVSIQNLQSNTTLKINA